MKRKEYKTYRKNRSLRLKGFHYRGPYVYFVTLKTRFSKKFFLDYSLGKAIIKHLKEARLKVDCKIYVYCVMPDHMHLLLSPSENGKDLSGVMQEIKGGSTKVFWECDGKGKLWQRGFYEHVLRRDENILATAEYILNNPVRKGLVEKWEDYPFCGILDPLPL